MAAMPPVLEADVGLLHIAGGDARATPPPGTLARSAPRRAGRGRAEDLLFLSLRVAGSGPSAGNYQQHLARMASEAFFRTPGSVTAALREAAAVVNDRLGGPAGDGPQAGQQVHFMAGVLRGADLFAAQCGQGELVLIRSGEVRRFSSSEARERPLTAETPPTVRYHHIELHPNDLLLLSTARPPIWSDPVLKAIGGFEPAQAIEQLSHSRSEDTTGLLLRFVPEGEAAASLPGADTRAGDPGIRPQAKSARPGLAVRVLPWVRQLANLLAPAGRRLRQFGVQAAAAVTRWLVRLAPGLIEPPRPGEFSPALLATTAVVIPLIVVALVSVVYLRRGRTQQFQAYLAEAQQAATTARAAEAESEAHEHWTMAQYWLERAGEYGDSQQRADLAAQVQAALDELEGVLRLEFTPLVSGGFGGDAKLNDLAATASDIYVLDTANSHLWHTWATGRGYEIDREFDCLQGPDTVPGMGTPVDIAIQPEPGALGAEGIVAIDADGTLLYCAPDRRPLKTQIVEPTTGFGRIEAIDVFGDTLYILDTGANAVWLYDASGGVFSGEAGIYFVEDVPDLGGAIDIAKSQEDLFILHDEGALRRCLRTREGEGAPIKVTCQEDLTVQNDLTGISEEGSAMEAEVPEMIYSPPPEPSLYFLDRAGGTVFHYSMRMVYQRQIRPENPFGESVSALTIGPPNDLFVAAGDQVYFAPLR